MNRRQFIKQSVALGLGCYLSPLQRVLYASPVNKKVLVLGLDGMDIQLTRKYLRQGLLPNIRKVVEYGSMLPVATSMPPQSPVAWSNVIVGSSTMVHGIYDFIHRDPSSMTPYLSTSRVMPPSRLLHIGDYNIPLTHGRVENLQNGTPFWEYLAERDIQTTIFKMPANFPCKHDKVDMVSGLGTPDLRGGYGNYTFLTTDSEHFKKDTTGGRIIPIQFRENEVRIQLPGPVNTFKSGDPESSIPITIWRDRSNPVVRIVIQDYELLLKKGEWSSWLRLNFPMIGPFIDVKGICKLYVKSVHPHFSLYISPLNIDPSEPALPVVSSEKYGRLLTKENGCFYTQGMPEDTKALSEGVLNEDEYLELAGQIIDERKCLLDFELKRFDRLDQGMLFFYFSSLDQNTHMYWRAIDSKHPLFEPEIQEKYGNILRGLYSNIDTFLGKILGKYDIDDPNFTLMIMSDHGFAPFRRQVNLNTWLIQNGYMTLHNTNKMDSSGYFTNVNWSKTSAYNLGINSIYLNLRGREKYGCISESQSKALRKEIGRKLLNLYDPVIGEKAVSRVWIVPEKERMHHQHAPDFIIGWNYGYRTSWQSILGGLTPDVFSDNMDKWSGDHCVDPAIVPAIMITNKNVKKPNPTLCDIAPTILKEFNIQKPSEMKGNQIF